MIGCIVIAFRENRLGTLVIEFESMLYVLVTMEIWLLLMISSGLSSYNPFRKLQARIRCMLSQLWLH
jgi:hypothetical protein